MDELVRQIYAWQKELERAPSQRLYHRIAEALLKIGRPAAALDAAEKGLFIHDRKYLACVEAKGLALLALGRYAISVETLKPVATQLGSVDTKRKLAMAMFGAGLDEDAKTLCRELLQANPFDRETKQLAAKGREALPPPITGEAPLPEYDETTAPATEAPPPTSGSAPAEETPPPAPAPAPPTSKPPPVAAIAVAGEATPVEKPAAVVKPVEPARPTAVPGVGIEGLVMHLSSETQKPLDAGAEHEAEELVDDFFKRIEASEARTRAPLAATPRPAESAPNAPAEVEVTAEEHSVEYDPTEGIHAKVDIEDVDVFSDLNTARAEIQTAPKPGADPAPAEAAEPTPESAPEAANIAEESPSPERKGWRGWFRRRRARKET